MAKSNILTRVITVVSRKYAPPPFATLASVQNAGGGGLYGECDDFSCDYTPPPSVTNKA